MKKIACKAFLCMVAAALSSCAGSVTDGAHRAASEPVAAPMPKTVAALEPSDLNTFSEQLLAGKSDTNFTIAMSAASGRALVEIDAADASGYKVTRLSSPDRLVLDLPAGDVKRSKNLAPAAQEIVNSVRVGSFNGGGRVVLDLAQPVSESVTAEGNKIFVSLQSGSVMAAKAAAGGSSENIESPSPEVIKSASAASVVDDGAGSGPRLTGLSIQTVPGQGNVVIADISSLGAFEFKKTAPSEYLASVPGATLDPAVIQTVLAQPNSGAIRSVRPVERDGDLVLRVFAQPEAELSAVANGNRLVIRNTADYPDFRAQEKVAPELPAQPESKPSATEARKDESALGDSKAGPIEDEFSALLGAEQKYTGRLISLDLQDTDIDNSLRIIAEVSNLNIIASSDVQGKVTLRLIDVPWDQALDVILKTNGLDKVQEGNVVRIAPVEKLRLERESLKQAQLAQEELEPLSVKYVRVSYARAEDMRPLIKSVLTERGDVSVDERSNQLIVKDIRKGLRNAVDLINKLDLRTPQVLLETQIVEANRTMFRDLGAQLGFTYIQSPETGNATGYNFPNSISIGGGIPGSTNASSFPAAVTGLSGSAVALAFGSADGSRSLDANISALEREGRIRIVSRPSVATTNNKAAEITSNETISVRKPSSGNATVVGGNGGIAGGDTATEKIKAGITLRVTPQASPDYYVLLDITAESSTLGGRVVDSIPSVIERKATSTVLVSSGQTFAIGGIYRLIDNNTVSGVPFLKDIPVLGHLFRRSLVDNSDEELLFFITPRIIEGSFDDAAMSAGAL